MVVVGLVFNRSLDGVLVFFFFVSGVVSCGCFWEFVRWTYWCLYLCDVLLDYFVCFRWYRLVVVFFFRLVFFGFCFVN